VCGAGGGTAARSSVLIDLRSEGIHTQRPSIPIPQLARTSTCAEKGAGGKVPDLSIERCLVLIEPFQNLEAEAHEAHQAF